MPNNDHPEGCWPIEGGQSRASKIWARDSQDEPLWGDGCYGGGMGLDLENGLTYSSFPEARFVDYSRISGYPNEKLYILLLTLEHFWVVMLFDSVDSDDDDKEGDVQDVQFHFGDT